MAQPVRLLPVGFRFGKLTVIRALSERTKNKRHQSLCRCDCGQEVTVITGRLRAGYVHSCGCYQQERCVESFGIHGNASKGSPSPEYTAWVRMKTRCYNPKVVEYPNYGGRGIRVAEEWLNDFEAFLGHVGPRPTANHSIDRIDNSGNYEPGNVRWATATVQSNNKRSNRILEHAGRAMSVSDWSRETGLKTVTILARLRKGWTVERALTEPNRYEAA